MQFSCCSENRELTSPNATGRLFILLSALKAIACVDILLWWTLFLCSVHSRYPISVWFLILVKTVNTTIQRSNMTTDNYRCINLNILPDGQSCKNVTLWNSIARVRLRGKTRVFTRLYSHVTAIVVLGHVSRPLEGTPGQNEVKEYFVLL